MKRFASLFPRHSAGRVEAIDVFRGVAIIGVVIYHLCWDLRFLALVDWAVDTDPAWLLFARVLLASFMLLTGMGLELGHASGFRPQSFWRRLALVALAALAITVSTLLIFPEAFVYFGVLHAIALFSLAGIVFVRLPWWAVLAVAAVFILPPVFFQSEMFNTRAMSVLGFWTVPPLTNDLVPIFPWFGFVLLGIVGARALRGSGLWPLLVAWRAPGPIARGLMRAGRWSLFIYLIHQPILLGVLTPLAGAMDAGTAQRRADFLPSCQQSCELGNGETGYCQRYCACALEQIEEGGLWDSVQADPPTPEQSREVNAVTNLCRAMANDP